MEKNRPSILWSNLLYFFAAFSLVALAYLFKALFPEGGGNGFTLRYYLQVIITEFGVVLLPALLYLLARKLPVLQTIRFHKLKWSQFFTIIGIAITGYVVIIFFNYLWMLLLTSLGAKLTAPAIPAMNNGQELVVGVLLIAGTAAVAEEFLFRGVILRGYERYGPKVAIVVSGVLFGILHMQTQSVLATVFLGILIGYLVYRTDSILAGMTYHFTNNAVAVLLSYAGTWALKMSEKMGSPTSPTSIDQLPPEVKIMTFAVLGFFAVGALAAFIGLLILLNHISLRRKPLEPVEKQQTVSRPKLWHFAPLAAGLVIVVGMYILDILHMFKKI